LYGAGNYGDNIRQAVLIRFEKTQASLPDEECLEHARTNNIWREWSNAVRETPPGIGMDEQAEQDEFRKTTENLVFTETGW
jgi:hypothetical protein